MNNNRQIEIIEAFLSRKHGSLFLCNWMKDNKYLTQEIKILVNRLAEFGRKHIEGFSFRSVNHLAAFIYVKDGVTLYSIEYADAKEKHFRKYIDSIKDT